MTPFGMKGSFSPVDEAPLSQTLTVFQVLDLDVLVSAIRGGQLDPCVLSGHRHPSVLSRLKCPQVCLDLSFLGPSVLFTGVMPGDAYTMSFVTGCPGRGTAFNFGLEYAAGYMAFFPPGAPLDSTAPGGSGNAILTIPVEKFHQEIALQFPEIPEDVLKKGAGFRLGVAEQEKLRDLLGMIEDAMRADGGALFLDPRALRGVEDELIEVYLSALRNGCGGAELRSGQRVAARFRRMGQAREYLASHATGAVRAEEIARAAGLSQRGLENLFRDFFGITPHAFLRRRRLCGANRALAKAAPVSGSVKKVALDWGFWHLGRFACDYRAVFGENPGSTLGREYDAGG